MVAELSEGGVGAYTETEPSDHHVPCLAERRDNATIKELDAIRKDFSHIFFNTSFYEPVSMFIILE